MNRKTSFLALFLLCSACGHILPQPEPENRAEQIKRLRAERAKREEAKRIENLKTTTAVKTNCRPEEIIILHLERRDNVWFWEAECSAGVVYRCSSYLEFHNIYNTTRHIECQKMEITE